MDGNTKAVPIPPRGRSASPASPDLESEIARLRKRVRQQDHAMARLSDAVIALRRGSTALREENRELRRQAEAARLARSRPEPDVRRRERTLTTSA